MKIPKNKYPVGGDVIHREWLFKVEGCYWDGDIGEWRYDLDNYAAEDIPESLISPLSPSQKLARVLRNFEKEINL